MESDQLIQGGVRIEVAYSNLEVVLRKSRSYRWVCFDSYMLQTTILRWCSWNLSYTWAHHSLLNLCEFMWGRQNCWTGIWVAPLQLLMLLWAASQCRLQRVKYHNFKHFWHYSWRAWGLMLSHSSICIHQKYWISWWIVAFHPLETVMLEPNANFDR